VVFAAAATTMAMQILLGTAGIGVAILVFVVLGNPSAGGPHPSMLSRRSGGPALPRGAGTTIVRITVYFGGNATSGSLWVLAAYAAGGLAVSLLAAGLLRRGDSRTPAAARRPGGPAPDGCCAPAAPNRSGLILCRTGA
jgi:hypothetical protein